MKKYRARILVVMCLMLVLAVFTNCGKGGGVGSSLNSSSLINQQDLVNIKGEYFLAYENDKIVHLKIDGHNISIELQKNNGGHSLFQGNVGNITAVGKNEFKIKYSKEACNPAGEEIVKMKTGTIEGTLEFMTEDGKNYVFYKTSKYNLPVWVISVTERYEDLSCSFESFKGSTSNASTTCVSFGQNGECSPYGGNVNGGYTMNGVSLNQVQQENPCISADGNSDQANMQRQVIQTRVQVQTNPNVPPTIVPRGDVYVGVTSMGDVAAVIGDGTMNPTFVAYLCPRPNSGQGTLFPQILVGAATVCSFKYITAANIVFPNGNQANFRALSPGGSSARQKFSFCQQ